MRNYKLLNDDELLLLIKKGEVHAFNEIYFRHFTTLYRFAYNILKNEEECSDAIQEIFVWIWENREKLDITSLKNYLIASVKYRLARVIQTSRRHAEIIAANIPVAAFTVIEDDIEARELKKVISDWTETLPPRARQIFQLSREQHLSNKEIALQLGISEKTVENQITIALKKLRSDLTKRMLSLLFL
ncbi:MAG: RNA polymerase sigma-70 factor [Chitinophaga sp.]|uniref:RNA polymerase sigma-70 factor n=1 Tax=Chitinophaga sp. TaxID=1869181 RepID=UPI001B27B3AE|nr:RNA polymerase sigma-70 factor [Chitinophaga sp.]MBO9727882.1 RNA polymerase sigma-70 factor [Chitinophaga sp.]